MAENITDTTVTEEGKVLHNLEALLRELAGRRQAYEKAKAEVDAKREAWEAENQPLLLSALAHKTALEHAEATTRTAVEKHYEDTGESKPAPGVEVKIVEVPVFEPADAAAWARQYMPGLLTLDEKAYGKVLREVTNSKTLTAVLPAMPGLMVADAKAYIARDLSAYLEAPNGSHSDSPNE
jgi:hypothetical protein